MKPQYDWCPKQMCCYHKTFHPDSETDCSLNICCAKAQFDIDFFFRGKDDEIAED